MARILLTHPTETRRKYYGERALAGLRALAEVQLHEGHDVLSPGALIEAARGVDVIIADRLTPGPAALFTGLPALKAVLRCAVDIRNIDVAAASAAGVLVTRASPGFVQSVVELALGYLVDLSRGISRATAAYHAGDVQPEAVMGRQLCGSTLGIIGYGSIGRALAQLAATLGMDGADCRSLCDDRGCALPPRILRGIAGGGGLRRMPGGGDRGDGKSARRRGVRAHEAVRVFHQPLARQSGG